MLLYVLCTAGEFVWNEGGVVPATCYLRLISQCVIFSSGFDSPIVQHFAQSNISKSPDKLSDILKTCVMNISDDPLIISIVLSIINNPVLTITIRIQILTICCCFGNQLEEIQLIRIFVLLNIGQKECFIFELF